MIRPAAIQSKFFLIKIGPLIITGGEDSRICLWSSDGGAGAHAQVGAGGSSSSHSHSSSPKKKIKDRGFKPY